MNKRTNLVRVALVAGAFWIGKQLGAGFRRGLLLHATKTRAELETLARKRERWSVCYETPEDFARSFNTAYGSLVRDGKEAGAIPAGHPERLDFRTPPVVRSNGINGIMRRRPGTDDPFVWVDPRKDFPA